MLQKTIKLLCFFIPIKSTRRSIRNKLMRNHKPQRIKKFRSMEGVIYHIQDYDVRGEGNKIYVDTPCDLSSVSIQIYGNNNVIKFGKNFRGECFLSMLGSEGKLLVGDNILLNQCHVYVENDSVVEFKGDSMLAKGCELYSGDAHTIIDYATKQKLNKPQDILIGSHCWFGKNARVMKGVTVADDCIIGAESLVLSSLTDSHACYAGSPAKKIKNGVSWDYPKYHDYDVDDIDFL